METKGLIGPPGLRVLMRFGLVSRLGNLVTLVTHPRPPVWTSSGAHGAFVLVLLGLTGQEAKTWHLQRRGRSCPLRAPPLGGCFCAAAPDRQPFLFQHKGFEVHCFLWRKALAGSE